jgi:class 3 adenylate cyclase
MADKTVQRRLAAILAADVVGYGRLMNIDEVRTLEAALFSRVMPHTLPKRARSVRTSKKPKLLKQQASSTAM